MTEVYVKLRQVVYTKIKEGFTVRLKKEFYNNIMAERNVSFVLTRL